MRTAADYNRPQRPPLRAGGSSPAVAVHTFLSAVFWIATSAAALGTSAYLAARADRIHHGGFDP